MSGWGIRVAGSGNWLCLRGTALDATARLNEALMFLRQRDAEDFLFFVSNEDEDEDGCVSALWDGPDLIAVQL